MSRIRMSAALMLLPAMACAADPQLDAARRCTALTDSLQRLACYDKVLEYGSPAAPAAVAPAPALGDESVKRERKEHAVAVEPSTLEAKVTAVRETRPDTFRVSLDNGQTWQQMDMSKLFRVAVGDAVHIEKGTLGGYRMALAGGRSGWVRVSRVQ